MELNEIYFFTATIVKWKKLLTNPLKDIIIESLSHLVEKGKINVYGFVIMPNHIHLIWEMVEMNGKEMPYHSFMKFTGHEFQKRITHSKNLLPFEVDNTTKKYQFRQRNSLPIHLFNRNILEQKLDYIHANPVQDHWHLVSDFTEYKYSSASFYELNDCSFKFITHYMDRI